MIYSGLNNTCYIVGAGDGDTEYIRKKRGDIVIAADGGYEKLLDKGINPDMAVGDFDSLGYVPHIDKVICHPVAKDDTDMMLAVKTGMSMGYKCFVIYGGMGGRTDHTIANMQVLSYIAHHECIGFMIDGQHIVTAISNSEMVFSDKAEGTVSVFSASDISAGVYLQGLRYPLKDATLKNDIPLGVSNEFMGCLSSIRITDGTAYVLWNGNIGQLIQVNKI